MSKTKVRKQTEQIFKELEKCGWHPQNISYGDGYFIFEHGEDMVVHFKVKECKGWLFAIWWDLEDNTEYSFFGQFEKEINKFKPTASTFVEEELCADKENIERDVKFYVCPIIKFIAKNPYLAWHYDCGYKKDIWEDYLTPFQARLKYIKYSIKYYHYYPHLEKKRQKKVKALLEKVGEAHLVNHKVIYEKNCTPCFDLVCDNFKESPVTSKGKFYDLVLEPNDPLRQKFDKLEKKWGRQYHFYLSYFTHYHKGHLSVAVKKDKKESLAKNKKS